MQLDLTANELRLERISEAHSSIMEAISDADTARAIGMIEALGESKLEVVRYAGFGSLGGTLLHAAVSMELADVMRALVEAGADLNVDSDFGSPANRLAARGNMPLLRYLIEQGADINFRSDGSTGCTLLMAAIANDRTDIALALLERGADCSDDLQSSIGYNAIDYAISRGNVTIFERLAELGAGTSARSKSPLELAIRRGAAGIVSACLSHPLLRAPFEASEEAQRALIAGCGSPAVREVLLAARSQQIVAASLDEVEVEDVPRRPRASLSL